MKVRTAITLLVVACYAAAILGKFLPHSQLAGDPNCREICELSATMQRFCGGAFWHAAAMCVLCWHMLGDMAGGNKGRDH